MWVARIITILPQDTKKEDLDCNFIFKNKNNKTIITTPSDSITMTKAKYLPNILACPMFTNERPDYVGISYKTMINLDNAVKIR